MESRMTNSVRIRSITKKDVSVVFQFIIELADFEDARDQVEATEESLLHAFGFTNSKPTAYCLFVEENENPVGMAIYFLNFSTWTGRVGIYLEDLYIQPAHRGKGYGSFLLSYLARESLQIGGKRLDWIVLDWNQKAIDVYEKAGAKKIDGWSMMRVTGDNLKSLADKLPDNL
ncbi:N-acetyltransferase Ats1 [Schizosaccharomyces cryophilus OY26]|uniref:N-acetyltransferase Ats1 n=1 Tax=Schizosaccharomyces cryophilus (strain OY26 / ATCC MYA-4695 / CBS 11777 / NBRC 106824 / NRRL Y48691) TaxID=653667 RepID=S9W4H1_SCHCR|nr:N-acetyltransferase Ats1 [Schizosaccharomyces cryophilus OY26]EPY53419.1 N-acetyltransferase Ats1 [Schizosaccharomyces cryophilus OY26]